MSADWTKELILDHREIDRQHALLFARLQRLSEALEGTRAEVEEAAAAFADELVSHVAAEEALMDESAFPDRARHKAAHELFVADFLQMRDEVREKGPIPPVVQWVRVRIPEWLRFHVRVNDAPLVAHLARRQPQGGAERRRGDGRRLS